MSLEKPNWNNMQDRLLYRKLFYYPIDKELTEQEEDFCRIMYHFEEYACELDG